jgi:hypothetical protein
LFSNPVICIAIINLKALEITGKGRRRIQICSRGRDDKAAGQNAGDP